MVGHAVSMLRVKHGPDTLMASSPTPGGRPGRTLPRTPFDVSLGMLRGAYFCVSESAGLGDVIGSAWRCTILRRPSSFR